MANHGANFANWLRDKIMKRYALYEVDAVYLDSVVARSGSRVHAERIEGRDPFEATKPNQSWKTVLPSGAPLRPASTALVEPDLRSHMISPTGAFPIGAKRDDWNVLYLKAMSEAKVMLFVLTTEYGNSSWCRKEFGQFFGECERRGKNAKRPLHGIALNFDHIDLKAGLGACHPERIRVLDVTKTDGECKGLAWDKGDYILDNQDLARLFNAMRWVV
jgi:hypothetical protein